jgi:hypothetical protein
MRSLPRRRRPGPRGLSYSAFSAVGLWQRQLRLYLVTVAVALVLHDVPGIGEAGDDAVGAALGDACPGRDVAQPHAWFVAPPAIPCAHNARYHHKTSLRVRSRSARPTGA